MNNKEYCENCGEEIQLFRHDCPESVIITTVFGCPKCDNRCDLCEGHATEGGD